jgi:hypothetical protein
MKKKHIHLEEFSMNYPVNPENNGIKSKSVMLDGLIIQFTIVDELRRVQASSLT